MKHDFDVVVAGGGPGGSSAANFLRQRGRSVLVLERARFPRFHVGESLLPLGNDLWRALGVFDELERRFLRKPGACFIHEESGAALTYYFEDAIRPGNPYAFQVKRAEFDQLLLDHARSLGAEVREETKVEDVTFSPDGIVARCAGADGRSYDVSAAVFVDATGRDALIARRRDLKVPDPLCDGNVALNAQFRGVERPAGRDAGNVVVGMFEGGWWWVIHFLDGDSSVGVVLEKGYTRARRGESAQTMMEEAIESLPRLKHMLRDAHRIIPVGSEGNWSYRARRFYGERLLLVGDAAAFVDPLFATGILLATQGAQFAAAHIDRALTDGDFGAERFAPYQTECLAGMEIFQRMVHEFYGANLRRLLVASGQNPTICRIMTSLFAGDVYRPAMWHGLVKEGFSLKAGAT
jgi:flavin-dependent dehydrogenase